MLLRRTTSTAVHSDSRFSAAAIVLTVAVCACAGSEPTALLTITPSGAQTITGPTLITANLDSTWALTGPGSLSGTSGRQVVYQPPALVNAATAPTATVTATAGSQTATVTMTVQPPPLPPGVIAGLSGPANVTYDAQGVPHIFCASFNDCLAVQGFIQARDRLFEMDFFRRAARGRLATLLGPLGVSQDKQILTLFVTRDGKRIEDVIVASLDADSKGKIQSFVNGVNAYLATLTSAAQLPGEYSQLPTLVTPANIPPWTVEDVEAFGRLILFQNSESLTRELDYGVFAQGYGPGGPLFDLGRFTAYIRSQQPIRDYPLSVVDSPPPLSAPPRIGNQAATSPLDLSAWGPGLHQARTFLQELQPTLAALTMPDRGSNNWVVDGAHSASGKAMLANDPHLALFYPPIWHLISMTASDSSGLDAAGVAFPGLPGVLIGRGKHVAWGQTTVLYDVTDLYLEQLSTCFSPPLPPLFCVHLTSPGSADVPLMPVTYQIAVAGQTATVPFTVLVVPHHGPLIDYGPKDTPATAKAVSVRWTGHEATNELKTFVGLNTATSVGDATAAPGTAFAALKNFKVGAFNFVLADDQGHIGYDPHAIVPKRPWASELSAGHLPWLPLTGDGSAEWGSGVVADNCAGTGANPPADNCWIPDNQLPSACASGCMVDTSAASFKGYVATANSDPAGYGDNNHPVAAPGVAGAPYLSFEWDDPTTVRYGRIAQLLKAKTASGGKVSVQDMQDIQGDHALYLESLFEGFYPDPSTVPAAQKTAYTAARAMIAQWRADGLDCPTGLSTSDPNGAADPDPKRNRDSAACLLFHLSLPKLLHAVFDDEFALLTDPTSTSGASLAPDVGPEIRGILYMLGLPDNDPGASFCNDIAPNGTTAKAHTCKEHLVNSLVNAFGQLSQTLGAPTNWLWGRFHTLTTQSPAAPLVSGVFQAGPFARPGGALTVDVGNPSGTQSSPLGFAYSSGSSIRYITQMGTDAASTIMKMQLPGSERDGPFRLFANAPDLMGQYVSNQYFDLLTGHQVDAAAAATQSFTAQ